MRLPGEQTESLSGRELLLRLKAQEAFETPLLTLEQVEYLKAYMQYNLQLRRLQLEQRRLDHRVRDDERRREQDERRLEIMAADRACSDQPLRVVADGAAAEAGKPDEEPPQSPAVCA